MGVISLYPGNGSEGDRIVEQLAYIPPNVSSEPLKILLWQGLNQDVWGGLDPREGDEIFYRESCLVTDCVLTEDRSQLESSDLVLFREHVSALSKSPGQLWLIFSLESPLHCSISSPKMMSRDTVLHSPTLPHSLSDHIGELHWVLILLEWINKKLGFNQILIILFLLYN